MIGNNNQLLSFMEKWEQITGAGSFTVVASFIHDWAKGRGFYPAHDGQSGKLLLVVTEIAEAVEALRKGDKEEHDEEIIDVLIRLLDYAAWQEIDIDVGLVKKMAKNETRPFKHNKKF